MTKKEKEQIIDNYIKSIRSYLNVGLCEGQANGSFGEDLMRHFDIIVESFKETTLIEHDLGIDAKTFINAVLNGVNVLEDGVKHKAYFCQKSLYVEFKKRHYYYRRKLLKDYGKTWGSTKEELEK